MNASMNQWKRFGMTACLLSLVIPPLHAAESRPRGTNAPAEDLFSPPRVYPLKIELSDSAVDALRKEPRHYVKGTVREGSRIYENVGVRIKGGTNAVPIDKKPGLTLKFNEFVKEQAFHGETRILLSHSQSDPTFLADAIGGEVFRAAGVPAPRATFAQVELNGRGLGLYVLGEAVNKEFLARYFKKSKGNLYEGSHRDITEKLEQDGGDTSGEQADVRALARAARENDPALRWKKLSYALDVDRFVSFVATEVLLWHLEGYALGRNNYRIYHDPASDQLVFLPHDLDRLCSKPDAPILPEWQGLVAKALMGTSNGQEQYRATLAKILDTAFKVEALHARIDQLAALVRPVLTQTDPATLRAFDEAIPQLRERITHRAAFVHQELKK